MHKHKLFLSLLLLISLNLISLSTQSQQHTCEKGEVCGYYKYINQTDQFDVISKCICPLSTICVPYDELHTNIFNKLYVHIGKCISIIIY